MDLPTPLTDEAVAAGARAIHQLACEDELVGETCRHDLHSGDAAHLEAHAALSAAAPLLARRAPMRLVIVESPFAGDVDANVAYARAAMADCLARGEAPYASHLLYTQPGVLDDDIPEQRALGIDAGLAWGEMADATVVYTDLGISSGMDQGIARAEAAGRPVEFRSIMDKLVRTQGVRTDGGTA